MCVETKTLISQKPFLFRLVSSLASYSFSLLVPALQIMLRPCPCPCPCPCQNQHGVRKGCTPDGAMDTSPTVPGRPTEPSARSKCQNLTAEEYKTARSQHLQKYSQAGESLACLPTGYCIYWRHHDDHHDHHRDHHHHRDQNLFGENNIKACRLLRR